MRYVVVAVHDQAVGAYMQPMFFRSRGEAMRSFLDAVSDEKSGFVRHPQHYHLAYLGEFDDGDGSFRGPPVPEAVLTALDCVAQVTGANGAAPGRQP